MSPISNNSVDLNLCCSFTNNVSIGCLHHHYINTTTDVMTTQLQQTTTITMTGPQTTKNINTRYNNKGQWW